MMLTVNMFLTLSLVWLCCLVYCLQVIHGALCCSTKGGSSLAHKYQTHFMYRHQTFGLVRGKHFSLFSQSKSNEEKMCLYVIKRLSSLTMFIINKVVKLPLIFFFTQETLNKPDCLFLAGFSVLVLYLLVRPELS